MIANNEPSILPEAPRLLVPSPRLSGSVATSGAPLPAKEREQAAAYYRELFADRKEAGAEEEAVAAELGSPQEAAQKVLEESGVQAKASSPARTVGGVLLMIFASIPAAIVLAALGAAGIGLLAAGVACAAAGLLTAVYSFVLMAMEGFAGGLLAQAGIGLGLAAVGLLLLPAFWAAAKGLFYLCKKVTAATAKLIGGRKEA